MDGTHDVCGLLHCVNRHQPFASSPVVSSNLTPVICVSDPLAMNSELSLAADVDALKRERETDGSDVSSITKEEAFAVYKKGDGLVLQNELVEGKQGLRFVGTITDTFHFIC